MYDDPFFLKKTFRLAKKGEGFTSPNPLVGAVITKNNKIIATGYHKKAGFPHAEIDALQKAPVSVRGATLYVNLEPCCFLGKTPPCVDRILKVGIKRVVIATLDPNPKVCGQSVKKLRKSGIEVTVGLLKEQAKHLNEIFFKNMETHLPFVAVKCAMSLDGKIATAAQESQWITERPARAFAKRLRDKYDAVLVGVNTVLKDNPHLDGIKKRPFKIIIDPHLKIPLTSFLLRSAQDKVIIISSCTAKEKKKRKLTSLRKYCHVYCMKDRYGVIDVKEICALLYKKNIMSVFVEGGSYTAGRFFDAHCVDKIYFFFAPKIIGGKEALPSIGGKGTRRIRDAVIVKHYRIKRVGKDFLIEGYPRFSS